MLRSDQIKYDNAVLVKEFLYIRALSTYSCHTIHQPYALMILKHHCYLYYLAEHETLDCVSQELKNRAKAFLEDKEIVKAFNQFLISISERDKNLFDFGQSDLAHISQQYLKLMLNTIMRLILTHMKSVVIW